MKKIFSLLIITALIIFSYGCGHNMVTYSDAVGFSTTINPETYTFGLNFHYGKLLQATVKDRTEITMNADGKMNNVFSKSSDNTSATSAPATLTIKTGNQITGYEVDIMELLVKNPEALKEWMRIREIINTTSTVK